MGHSVTRNRIPWVSFVISRRVECTSAAAKLYRSFVMFDNTPYTRNTIQCDTLRSAAPQVKLVKLQLVCAIGMSMIAFRDFHFFFRGWWGVEALRRSYIDRSSQEQHNTYRRRIEYNFCKPSASPAASITRSDALSAHVNRNVGSNQQGLLCMRKDRICLFVVRGIHSSDLSRIQYVRSTSTASIKQAPQGRSGKAFNAVRCSGRFAILHHFLRSPLLLLTFQSHQPPSIFHHPHHSPSCCASIPKHLESTVPFYYIHQVSNPALRW